MTRFENALEFLDSPGEWYLDEEGGWLYYKPQPWQNMRAADVELPVLEALIRGRGTATKPIRNVEFRGLTFSYATWLQPKVKPLHRQSPLLEKESSSSRPRAPETSRIRTGPTPRA